jgi:hypothetical protein
MTCNESEIIKVVLTGLGLNTTIFLTALRFPQLRNYTRYIFVIELLYVIIGGFFVVVNCDDYLLFLVLHVVTSLGVFSLIWFVTREKKLSDVKSAYGATMIEILSLTLASISTIQDKIFGGQQAEVGDEIKRALNKISEMLPAVFKCDTYPATEVVILQPTKKGGFRLLGHNLHEQDPVCEEKLQNIESALSYEPTIRGVAGLAASRFGYALSNDLTMKDEVSDAWVRLCNGEEKEGSVFAYSITGKPEHDAHGDTKKLVAVVSLSNHSKNAFPEEMLKKSFANLANGIEVLIEMGLMSGQDLKRGRK